MHDHEETVLLVYRQSHALDRRSLHAILARVAEFIDMFERILVEAARSGQVRLGDSRVAANILTFLPIIVAMRRWDLGRRKVTRKDLYEVRDQVARVTINRPKQYNAFTGDTLREMTLDEEVVKWCAELLALSPTCLRILKASFVEEFGDLLGQGDQLRRYLTGPEFWAEEQQEGARAVLEKRPPDFARFRRRRA
ncbi:MAG TPA: hypothetical protein VGT40_00990 [Methylomirabilota bacterium]|nr:hypothetical protein [Methylomirabilota bacterium]